MIKYLIFICFLVSTVGCSFIEDLAGGSSGGNGSGNSRPGLPTQVTFGLDWLGAQHPGFGLGAALEEIPTGTKVPLGVLDYTFGESMAPISLILGSGKVNHFRVHFINGPCVRNRNCGSYDYGAGHNIDSFSRAVEARDQKILNLFRSRVSQFCPLIDQYPSVRFYFSPILEHNLTVNAFNVLYQELKATCNRDDYYVVNNPVGTHSFPRYPVQGGLYENHNWPEPAIQIHSMDGADAYDLDIPGWKNASRQSGAGISYIWSHAYNCRPRSGRFIDPRNRNSCADRAEHRRLISLLTSDSIGSPTTPSNPSTGGGNGNTPPVSPPQNGAAIDCHDGTLHPSAPDGQRVFPGDVGGKSGTLYIGESETRQGIVVILRASYGRGQKVTISGSSGTLDLNFSGWANPEWHGSARYCRAHWRLELSHGEIERRTGSGPWTVRVDNSSSWTVRRLKDRMQ